jgi:16S rRNA A1518/A1519 N6-dimethyltransferase RsmA/KsgA/DIM1 with predicted DNA glycosylase/AP lyase activity
MLKIVPAKSFFPAPKVDSAIIKLTNIKPKMPDFDIDIFFQRSSDAARVHDSRVFASE